MLETHKMYFGDSPKIKFFDVIEFTDSSNPADIDKFNEFLNDNTEKIIYCKCKDRTKIIPYLYFKDFTTKNTIECLREHGYKIASLKYFEQNNKCEICIETDMETLQMLKDTKALSKVNYKEVNIAGENIISLK